MTFPGCMTASALAFCSIILATSLHGDNSPSILYHIVPSLVPMISASQRSVCCDLEVWSFQLLPLSYTQSEPDVTVIGLRVHQQTDGTIRTTTIKTLPALPEATTGIT
ncbi:hypothetical protein F5Y15DRAFT_25116 [Xylariaceae sp. FL0016]|nr:hypothetical protein F5Y15DRAFT_25116 [Xylariaceae sp. FL0016]